MDRRVLPVLAATNRRLVRRYDRKAEHFQAFADLAAALLSYRRLVKATK
jgi:hypothetical protein